jgi:murein DD-endopeptidase MepM/ murein hydrolase activator NlpD
MAPHATPRTFKMEEPLMRGSDIREWQELIIDIGQSWNVHFPLKADGTYGMATRSFSKMVLFGRGFTHEQLDNGITPWLRELTRHPNSRSDAVRQRASEPYRKNFRETLRNKFQDDPDVAAPIGKILTMTWGYHPGVHDGIDLICGPKAPIYALCDAVVIDVRASGWWGKGASGEIWRGDGIIQIQCVTDDGPFRKGMHFGYGHAEGADVHVGQEVKAGARLGEAGLAVAWHVHLMGNNGEFGLQGKGSFDPRPFVNYAIRNA